MSLYYIFSEILNVEYKLPASDYYRWSVTDFGLDVCGLWVYL